MVVIVGGLSTTRYHFIFGVWFSLWLWLVDEGASSSR